MQIMKILQIAIDNGVKSSNSQTVITKYRNRIKIVTFVSLGLLGMLGGFVLALGKKKKTKSVVKI